MSKRIYIAEDEKTLLELMTMTLQRSGYITTPFTNGDDLFKEFNSNPCDLVILDVNMPGTDGITICKKIREFSNVWIIILTAVVDDTTQLSGYLSGADAYIRKPFSTVALVMQVDAFFKRDSLRDKDLNELSFGDLTYSINTTLSTCKGEEFKLTGFEGKFLGYLMKANGKPVDRAELLEMIWGKKPTDEDFYTTRVTDEMARKVRTALASKGSNVTIKAVYGKGYRLELKED